MKDQRIRILLATTFSAEELLMFIMEYEFEQNIEAADTERKEYLKLLVDKILEFV